MRREESNLAGNPCSTVPTLGGNRTLRAFTRSAAPRPGHLTLTVLPPTRGCYILRSNPRGYPDLFKTLPKEDRPIREDDRSSSGGFELSAVPDLEGNWG